MDKLHLQLNKVVQIFNRMRISQGKVPYMVVFNVFSMDMTIGEIMGYQEEKREPITTDEVIEFHTKLREMGELKL